MDLHRQAVPSLAFDASVAGPDVVAMPDLDLQSAKDLWMTLQAIGMMPGPALGQVALACGLEAVRPLWKAMLEETAPRAPEGSWWTRVVGRVRDLWAPEFRLSGEGAMAFLDGVGEIAPETANALLGEGLASGCIRPWVQVQEDSSVGQPSCAIWLLDKPWLTSLPADCDLKASLIIRGCDGLPSLPQGLTVEGDLEVERCAALTTLPDNLKVGSILGVAMCPALEALPSGCRVRYSLRLSACGSLASIPGDLEVGGSLDVANCPSLRTLHPGVKIGTNCHLWGCGSLETLPDGLQIPHNLSIIQCASFHSLPGSLTVAKDLTVRSCAPWNGILPEGVQVGGKVYAELGDKMDFALQGVLPDEWRAKVCGRRRA